MTKRKERGILDMLTTEQAAVIDSHGYAFLAEQGYNVTGVEQSAKKRRKLKAALRANSQTLEYSLVDGKETGVMFLFFSLIGADGEFIARSKGIKFVFRGDDDGN